MFGKSLVSLSFFLIGIVLFTVNPYICTGEGKRTFEWFLGIHLDKVDRFSLNIVVNWIIINAIACRAMRLLLVVIF